MTKFQNMKIEINEDQPLDYVVRELERVGYIRKQKFSLRENIVATDDDGEFYVFSNDALLDDFKLTTLTQLKEMI